MIALAGRCHSSILAQRQHLTPGTVDPLENSPPLVAFTTIALGGFRGLLVDWLWLRANRMQEEGRTFELVQLSNWITTLEPRFAPVWAYHAWNMSYNVSVLFTEPEDKWRWVEHGINLLRDDGLLYNPGEAPLYWELGWLYQHKIGQNLDQAHAYYKRKLAESVSAYLPSGSRNDIDNLLQAPCDKRDLLAIAGMKTWLERAKQTGVDIEAEDILTKVLASEATRNHLETTEQGRMLLGYLRRTGLQTKLKLDPAYMAEIDRTYGPLDWRLPQAHAIYWAKQGAEHAESEFDKLRLNRMLFQSMVNAFFQGRAFYDIRNRLTLIPNLDILPNVLRVLTETIAAQPNDESLKTTRLNFLKKAIHTLHMYNHISQAKETYDQMVEWYPESAHPSGMNGFLLAAWSAETRDMDSAQALRMVESTLMDALWSSALGDEERSQGLTSRAELIWKRFQRGLTKEQEERVGLPPLPQIKQQALQRLILLQEDDTIRTKLQTMVR